MVNTKMSFTRLAAGLILITDIAAKSKGNKDVTLGINWNYIAVCAMILLVVGFGIDIFEIVKDRNLSHEEHVSLKENQNTIKEFLTKDHSRISREISAKYELFLSEQSCTTSEFRTSVKFMGNLITFEADRLYDMLFSIAEGQRNVHNQLDAIYALNQRIRKLENEKQQIEKKLNSENSQKLTKKNDE